MDMDTKLFLIMVVSGGIYVILYVCFELCLRRIGILTPPLPNNINVNAQRQHPPPHNRPTTNPNATAPPPNNPNTNAANARPAAPPVRGEVNGQNNNDVNVVCLSGGHEVRLNIMSFNEGSVRGEARENECSICFAAFEKGGHSTVLGPCNHKFHADCIAIWLAINQTCPLCRTAVQAAS